MIAPTGLLILTSTAKTVTIGWTPPPGVTGYKLYRDGVQISTAGAAAVKVKFGVSPRKQYALGIEASSPAGTARSTITVKPSDTTRWAVVLIDIPPDPPPPPPPPPPTGWTLVATEGQAFVLSETKEVRYGAGTAFASKVLGAGTYYCSNAFFGDPAPNQDKVCQARATVQPPPPPPPPPPTPTNVARSNPTAKVT